MIAAAENRITYTLKPIGFSPFQPLHESAGIAWRLSVIGCRDDKDDAFLRQLARIFIQWSNLTAKALITGRISQLSGDAFGSPHI
ncbi:hypothetical protein D3C78_1064610 [compost metagenome]